MKNNQNDNLVNNVMEAIHKEKVKMKSKSYFIIGSFLLVFGLVINLFLAIFFFAVAVFRLRTHTPFDFLGFGQHGIKPFVATFPWFIMMLGLASIVGGIYLLKKYDFSYKKNFLHVIIWLIILVVGAGFLLDQTGFNDRAEHMRAIKAFYQIRSVGQSWLVGQIVYIEKNKIIVTMLKGIEIEVLISDQTKLPTERSLTLGDNVKVVGQKLNGHFEARAIALVCADCADQKLYNQGLKNRACLINSLDTNK